jgi:hypothetical protein
MKWLALSALVSFMRVRSVCVGAVSLHPSSAKYCLILRSVSIGNIDKSLCDNLLLVLELEVVSEIVHIDFEIVNDECCRSNVCHEVIDVPTRHLTVPEEVRKYTMAENECNSPSIRSKLPPDSHDLTSRRILAHRRLQLSFHGYLLRTRSTPSKQCRVEVDTK